MSLFGIELNGEKIDITQELKKDDEKMFDKFFGAKSKINHISNFSKQYNEKKDLLDFFESYSTEQAVFYNRVEELNLVIEEEKENNRSIKKYVDEKDEIKERFTTKSEEHENKALEYLPYTDAEEKLEEDNKIEKWSERFKKKVNKDYMNLINMITDDKSYDVIKNGLDEIDKSYEKNEISSSVSPRFMFLLMLGAKNRTSEKMGK